MNAEPGDRQEAAEGPDEPVTNGDDEQEEGEAAVRRRSQRRRLEKAKKEELGDWSFFEEHDPSETFDVVLRGEGIGTDGGDAEKIGSAVARVARLFKSLVNGEAYMQELGFANSVHIRFRPSKEEEARARHELERARQTKDTLGAEQALKEAVTDLQVATALAADLLEAAPSEAPERAVTLGTAVAQAYKSLATAVARDRLTVSVEAPKRDEPVQLTASKAERVTEALKEVTAPQKFVEIVVGTLSIADATQKTFGLLFDPSTRKPETFKGKRLIRGSYTPQVEDLIRDKGLWGRRVRATIEVERDALVSTSNIRPAQYRLLDVEEAAT